MPLPLIKALAPALLVLALVVPLVTGFLGRRLRVSVGLGWGLFVLAILIQDILSVQLARHFHGEAGVSAVTVDPPGLAMAILWGWTLPLLMHGVGDIVAYLMKRR